MAYGKKSAVTHITFVSDSIAVDLVHKRDFWGNSADSTCHHNYQPVEAMHQTEAVCRQLNGGPT
jgi:hypothetical protein